MTYQQLLERLQRFTPQQLATDCTIYDENEDEYFGCVQLEFTDDTDDRLNPNHPYFTMHSWVL